MFVILLVYWRTLLEFKIFKSFHLWFQKCQFCAASIPKSKSLLQMLEIADFAAEANWQTYLYLWRGCHGCQELPILQNLIPAANRYGYTKIVGASVQMWILHLYHHMFGTMKRERGPWEQNCRLNFLSLGVTISLWSKWAFTHSIFY